VRSVCIERQDGDHDGVLRPDHCPNKVKQCGRKTMTTWWELAELSVNSEPSAAANTISAAGLDGERGTADSRQPAAKERQENLEHGQRRRLKMLGSR
jgi:hypothetical protein